MPNRYVKNIGFTAFEFKSEQQQRSKQSGNYETIDIRKSFQRKLFADLDINGRTIHCKRPSEIFQTAFPYHDPTAV
ncbi:hypothetical protein HMPREF9016_01384 [Neisseria sp. oral taxon 014 str. F0314]|nr:hypothetical protein HMPREF9016_01384 [Neisseria sp. oral taxon 014 str. F0314]